MNRHLWRWLPLAILACFWWGLFGFIAKLGTEQVNAYDMQILFTAGMLPLAALALARRKGLRSDTKGRIAGTVLGVLAGLGNAAYFAAMARGKASLVGPITSLFPLVTVVLATALLKERFNRVQMAGIVVALISAVLLAM